MNCLNRSHGGGSVAAIIGLLSVGLASGCADRALYFGSSGGESGGETRGPEERPEPIEPERPEPDRPTPRGCGDGELDIDELCLEDAIELDAGIDPCAIVAADIDRDGHVDLAVPNSDAFTEPYPNVANVLYGTGDGRVSSPYAYKAGGNLPVAIAAGAVDFAPGLELVVVNYEVHEVTLLRNAGKRDFHAGVPSKVGQTPQGVAAGDLNNDGLDDVVVTNGDSGDLTVLLSTGDGLVDLGVYSLGALPVTPVIADINRDGVADVLVTNMSSGDISVLVGLGGGALLDAGRVPVGEGPFGLAVADLDDDGRPDVVVANEYDNTLGILRGRGDGGFNRHSALEVGWGPRRLALADMNGDGALDIAVAHGSSEDVWVLLGDGELRFTHDSTYSVGALPSGIVAADLNEDGMPDLAVANQYGNSVSLILSNP
ncbi:MAG: VCBS repeat-containing protein [Myxococcales bacterium]|nr:VCBS repeat-containing protein [Myxococcales bacterium]